MIKRDKEDGKVEEYYVTEGPLVASVYGSNDHIFQYMDEHTKIC